MIPQDPQDFLRKHLPASFDADGKPISALIRAKALAEDATAEQVRAVLLLVAGNSDRLEIDAVLAEIGSKTKRRFKVATLKALVREIQAEGKTLAPRPDWVSLITLSPEGEPCPIAANVLIALRNAPEWQDVLAFDEFHHRSLFMRKPPWANGHWHGPAAFTDADENRVLIWIQEAGIHCRIEAVRQALSIVCDDNKFHPVRDYLDSLAWDGVPRLNNWLSYYLGVDPIANYTEQVGRCWLVSAVARIYAPGSMAKYALILEGEQDLGKSTALEVLGHPWFTDDMSELGTKDSAMQAGNAWIVELSELDSTRRGDINTIKAFLSRKHDRFRKPFGRYVEECARQCVIAGTVNPSTPYLADETGGVRFWPVLCTAIDIEALRRDRDQLWAEACVLYKSGTRWFLDNDDALTAAHDQQEQRFATDSWEDAIRDYLDLHSSLTRITTAHILSHVFSLDLADHDKYRQTRVGTIMTRRLKWPKAPREHGSRREYARPGTLPD